MLNFKYILLTDRALPGGEIHNKKTPSVAYKDGSEKEISRNPLRHFFAMN